MHTHARRHLNKLQYVSSQYLLITAGYGNCQLIGGNLLLSCILVTGVYTWAGIKCLLSFQVQEIFQVLDDWMLLMILICHQPMLTVTSIKTQKQCKSARSKYQQNFNTDLYQPSSVICSLQRSDFGHRPREIKISALWRNTYYALRTLICLIIVCWKQSCILLNSSCVLRWTLQLNMLKGTLLNCLIMCHLRLLMQPHNYINCSFNLFCCTTTPASVELA